MATYHCFIAVCTAIICLQPSWCSYLGYPRIHFAGQFRGNSGTRNNDRCNYHMDKELNPDLNSVDWGFNGTNEFEFFNTYISSVVYQDGSSSVEDPVVGRHIIGNLERPFAKLTDLDTDCQDHSTIYGLKFGIKWSEDFPDDDTDIAFYGNWTRSIVAQSMWPRLKCYNNESHGSELYQGSFALGAQSTTKIKDILWKNLGGSLALSQLQIAVGDDEDLVVRITFHYYTRNYPSYVAYNATLGYVIGVIGVPSDSDTLNVPGEREMTATGQVPHGLSFESCDLCHDEELSEYGPWMYTAPLEVDETNNEVHVDLSNSIPSDLHNNLRDIGTLRLGILWNSDSCVQLLGEETGIPYTNNNALPITSGIYTIPIDPSLIDAVANNPLVIVQELDDETGTATICGEEFFSTENSHSVQILLQEATYFIRPYDYYVDRLEKSSPPSFQTLYVTRFGEPVPNMTVNVRHKNQVLPANGVKPKDWNLVTNQDGFAKFEFKVHDVIPPKREYASPPCPPDTETVLPIDGQVYYFEFCVMDGDGCNDDSDYSPYTIVFLAFSEISNTPPYTWIDDVGPILSQFARLSPIMNTILNMSSYNDTTKSHNLNLMNLTLRLDFEDPSYMPTTRDLSPAKRNMILEWLEDPIYSQDSSVPEEIPQCMPPQTFSDRVPEYFVTPRCEKKALKFKDGPDELEPYFKEIFHVKAQTFDEYIRNRPLFKAVLKEKSDICTRDNIATQLQTAIQLEWGTIPVYLTSLYSIIEGCNTEIYELIRSVIMQEMLHMTLAANMLIGMNGSPVIDDASVTPSYPTKLPGGVLPELTVNLEKLSLAHVHNVFMGIEVPQVTLVGGPIYDDDLFTIGAFYDEISTCIKHLVNQGTEIFNTSTVDEQVNWPWDPTSKIGYIDPITDSESALNAIDLITSQGEGSTLLNPNDIENDTLGHFFKFEEIVCQKHLVKINELQYAYSGDPIPFDPNGVWPMRPNPTLANVLPGTNCFTESKAFHTTYRAFLQKLHEVFNGSPDEIFAAVKLMESLQVHAKRLMWTKYLPNSSDESTCGPVWEYDWPILHCK